MVMIPDSILFSYAFISQPNELSKQSVRDVSAILSIEAWFVIQINQIDYLNISVPILELYKALYRWKEQVKPTNVPEFHYYSVEHDDKDGAILSMLPFSSRGRITSIWGEVDVYNVLPLNDLVVALFRLENDLKSDIETYFGIELDHFVQNIPYRLMKDDC